MYATERQQLIEQLISTHGRVVVVDLARSFGVTTETIRRDLDHLESIGAVRRVHGGAVATSRTSTLEVSVDERSGHRTEAKQAIARRALAVIPAGFSGSLYLDAGTTTAAFAQALRERTPDAAPLEIVTHSMAIAHQLAGVAGINLTAIGGRVRGITAAAVGAQTVTGVGRLRPDIAFVGTNGISPEFGLSTPDPDEADVKRAIIAAAQRVVVLADADKFTAELLVSFATLDQTDLLVTDAEPGAALAEGLSASDTEVWIA